MSHVSQLVDILKAGGSIDEVLRLIGQFSEHKHRTNALIKVGRYLVERHRFDDALRFIPGAPGERLHIQSLQRIARAFHHAGNIVGARSLLQQSLDESEDEVLPGPLLELAATFAECGQAEGEIILLRRILNSLSNAALPPKEVAWPTCFCVGRLADLGFVDEASAVAESIEDKGVQLHALAHLHKITGRLDSRLTGKPRR